MQAYLTRPVRTRPGTRVGATYALPVDALSPAALEDECKRLTLQARCTFGKPPPPFCAYHIADGVLHLPRFFGLRRFGAAEHDDRSLGDPASEHLRFFGTLTEVQTRADQTIHRGGYGPNGDGGTIVCLPCGYGKTVFAIHQACKLGRRTFVLVHKAVIRDQWRESFERFCPGVRVGIVQGDVCEMDARFDVVVGMIMTVVRRDVPVDAYDSFGFIVCDEAHHLAAPVMNQALQRFRAARVMGLTATPERPDGLTPLLHWSLGDEGFRVERESEGVRVSIALFAGGTREITTRGGTHPLVAVMVNQLATNQRRNRFIAERIMAYRATGRVIMVLSDRLVQLDALRTLVVGMGLAEEDVGVFKGGQRDEERTRQLARPVVMCSFGMANEGVDKREADTLVLATPKSRVVQGVGRIQRPCPTKKSPLVLDVVDDVSVFPGMRWTRQRWYSKEGYAVQVHAADTDADNWFA
jgi:superfamily II DNA or RNA helicase